MSDSYAVRTLLPDHLLWERMLKKRLPLSFDLEVTARCNNDCRHCYINLPAGDDEARRKELSLDEINAIADQAVSLGALWCLVTGGSRSSVTTSPISTSPSRKKGSSFPSSPTPAS